MPYAKRRRNYRKSYRKGNRTAYSKANTAMRLAKKALGTQELLYNETNQVSTAANYGAGQTWSLCEISQGDTNNSRHGNKISPTSLVVKGCMKYSGFGVYSPRLIIFRWTTGQPTEGLTGASDIIDTTLGASGNPIAPKSEGNRYVSKILYDRTFANWDSAIVEKTFYKKIKLQGMIGYDEVNPTPNRNGIFAMWLTNTVSNVTAGAATVTSRLFYRDA